MPSCPSPFSAQRAFASSVRGVQPARKETAPPRQTGLVASFSILPPAVKPLSEQSPLSEQPYAVIQRSIDGDLAEGWASINTAQGYEGEVINRLDPYTGKISQLGQSGDGHYEDAGQRMAGGFKQWSANFYNKTQAYLYEAQKADEKTDLSGRGGRNSFGILGVDTDEEADLEVYTERLAMQQGRPVLQGESNTAVEVKASTSPNYEAVDKLVTGGVGQLKKREATGRFSQLELELHNDNQANSWPITAHTLATTYGNDPSTVLPLQWGARLQARIASLKATKGVGLPLKVSAEHSGVKYAEVTV